MSGIANSVLLLLLPLAWLAVVLVVLAACQAAARGEQSLPRTDEIPSAKLREDAIWWDGLAAQALMTRGRARLGARAVPRRAGRAGAATPRPRRVSRGMH